MIKEILGIYDDALSLSVMSLDLGPNLDTRLPVIFCLIKKIKKVFQWSKGGLRLNSRYYCLNFDQWKDYPSKLDLLEKMLSWNYTVDPFNCKI